MSWRRILRAYVQVEDRLAGSDDERRADQRGDGVLKIEGTQTYRHLFDARLRDFTQLLPNYMHVRFSSTMLISPSSMPKDDVFERKDNYYVYLKPFDVADEVVLKRMRFPGKPPVWIPCPPTSACPEKEAFNVRWPRNQASRSRA
jgi:putative ABC transport system ATP-binding protein/macrolide transport system ATP-binding/permease protein/lipoprotein-releasing system ATP-binding protein